MIPEVWSVFAYLPCDVEMRNTSAMRVGSHGNENETTKHSAAAGMHCTELAIDWAPAIFKTSLMLQL